MSGKSWIVGERFTLADMVLYCALDFGAGVGQARDPAQKNLDAWCGCHVQISAVAHDHGECHESDGKSAAKNGTKRGTRQALAGRNWHYVAQSSST